MASKWKYANIDAESRLEMLRNGNKDVFDEEIERTKSVVSARRELGLDTKEQENWVDAVGYNYNLYNAERMGESQENVSTNGYAKLYLGESTLENNGSSDGKISAAREYKTTTGITATPITNAKLKIKAAGELAKTAISEKYDKMKQNVRQEMYKENKHLREALLNDGASDDGGKMARAYAELEESIESICREYDEAKEQELSDSEKKYAGLVDTLLEYRRKGTAVSALSAVANGLIQKAAAEDGYDMFLVPGVEGSKRKSSNAVSEDKENENDTDISTGDNVRESEMITNNKVSRMIPRTDEASRLSEKSTVDDSADDYDNNPANEKEENKTVVANPENAEGNNNDEIQGFPKDNNGSPEVTKALTPVERIISLLGDMGITGNEAVILAKRLVAYLTKRAE